MNEVFVLLIKGVVGGVLVMAFALLSEALSPKRFAGLFSAAPAVALAGLAIALLDKGAHEARENAIGMLAGSGGMVLYAAAVISLLRRMRALRSAAVALIAWMIGAALLTIPVVML